MDVQKFSGENKYAKYSSFSVASEADKYKLTVGGYSGTAGNRMPLGKNIYFIYIVYSKCDQLLNFILGESLSHHNGKKFSTKDQDNDTSGGKCAVSYESGWWFGDCFQSNLNGRNNKSAVQSWKGIIWHSFGKITLKSARMMIRSNA